MQCGHLYHRVVWNQSFPSFGSLPKVTRLMSLVYPGYEIRVFLTLGLHLNKLVNTFTQIDGMA